MAPGFAPPTAAAPKYAPPTAAPPAAAQRFAPPAVPYASPPRAAAPPRTAPAYASPPGAPRYGAPPRPAYASPGAAPPRTTPGYPFPGAAPPRAPGYPSPGAAPPRTAPGYPSPGAAPRGYPAPGPRPALGYAPPRSAPGYAPPPGAAPRAAPRYGAPPPTQHRYGAIPPPGVGPIPPPQPGGFPGFSDGMTPGAPSRKSPRIDPAQMPRPQIDNAPLRYPPKRWIYGADPAGPPPPPTGSVLYDAPADDPNCSPRYARCSTATVLAASQAQKRTKLPLAITLRPLAQRRPEEAPVKLADFGAKGPPRCGRCGAFVCGFAAFKERTWACHLCQHENALPEWYRCAAPNGKRTDRFERPELASASVDFLVRGAYCQRPVQAPIAVLVLDLSFDDQSLKDIIGDVLDVIPPSQMTSLALVTFTHDGCAHAWRKARANGSHAGCAVANEGFCALPTHQWLGTRDLFEKTCATMVEAAPALRHEGGKAADGCRVALECAVDGLKERGGRVFLVSRTAPTLDKKLARTCSSTHVAIDAFWLDGEGRTAPKHARALGGLCRATGGLLHYCDAQDLDVFRDDFAVCARGYFPSTDVIETGVAIIDAAEGGCVAHEAALKIRCSTGLRVKTMSGPGVFVSKDELNVASVRGASTFCVDLERFVNFEAGKRIYVQCALLYSDPATKRRLVRVHNICLQVVSKPSEHYKFACLETAFSSLVRTALMSSGLCRAVYAFDDLAGLDKLQLSGDALKSARDVLQRTCVEALYEYRVACASRSPPGQLILPESIKLLPLLVLGAFKGLLLRSASPQQPGAGACERAATLELAMSAPSAWLCRCAAPRGYLFPPEQGGLNPIPASASSCAPLSLLDCASHLYVHVASGAPPDSRQALRLACGVRTSGDRLPRIDVGLNALRAQMSRDAPRPPPLLLLDEPALDGRATLDDETRRARRRLAARADLLIEDPSAHGPPYVDFLCAVHRQIQQKMAADRQG